MENKFCSRLSISLGENLFGTAAQFSSLLLVEYAQPWQQEALKDNTLSEEVLTCLQDKKSAGFFSRLLFIKKQKPSRSGINIFAIGSKLGKAYLNHWLIKDYKDLISLDYAALFESQSNHQLDASLYLVCTNGKKDKCCSKFGIPVWEGLSQLADNVWQCTHVGGDRFAPNVLQVPSLHQYGHISVEEIKDFFLTTRNQAIYISRYRGNCNYSKNQQAAEYFLRNHLHELGFGEIMATEYPDSDKTNTYRFFYQKLQQYFEVTISVSKAEAKRKLTCHDELDSPINVFDLVQISQASKIIS